MRARANGIELEYDSTGAADAPAILMIMGLGTQMTRWPPALIERLVRAGYRVIRFDNRDVGLSTRLDEAGTPDMPALLNAMLTGQRPPVAYSLEDMAADAVGLLGALGIDRAHLVGASMGGMIAQIVAARYPARTLSLTSIMSSSGNPALPRAADAILAMLASPRPDPADEDAIVERTVIGAGMMGSPAYPVAEEVRRAAARDDYRRGYYPAGIARHTAAIVASGDRRPLLRKITAPTVVIHGLDDPLVPIEAGRDTARNIAGAELIEIPGMGHDLPDPLVPIVAEAILAVTQQVANPVPSRGSVT
jgi:pimeloyl-ACP methyl ester carboxylesterase